MKKRLSLLALAINFVIAFVASFLFAQAVPSANINPVYSAAMLESGDVMGVFVGHDHDNDYAVMWKNILLAYGRYTGGNTVYNHLPNGARIIVLDEGARTFTSWIRQKDGIVDKVSYPASFVKDDWTKR
jgi:hypothetical protein